MKTTFYSCGTGLNFQTENPDIYRRLKKRKDFRHIFNSPDCLYYNVFFTDVSISTGKEILKEITGRNDIFYTAGTWISLQDDNTPQIHG